MAENAAHLSSAPQKNPSIFEVIAQESLTNSLQATTKVLFDIISNKDNRYNWLSKWHDEIFLCFNCFLQYHYLKNFGGSFSEAFYNLQRAPKDPSKFTLSFKENFKSLAILVFLPYASDKLRIYLNDQSGNQLLDPNSEKHKLLKMFLSYYNYFRISYDTIKMIKFVRYMMGSSTTHTPLLDLAGVRLIYQSDESKKFPDFSWKDVLLSPFRSDPSERPDLKSIFVKILCQGLEFSAFFIQFLTWWQSDESRAKLNGYPVPSAPHSKLSENSMKYNGLCPICMRKRRVEVVLQTSGYVFCYKCILEVINKTGKCPVTGLPSASKDLIRVYDSVFP